MSVAYLVFETVDHEARGGFDDIAMSTGHLSVAEAFVELRGGWSEEARGSMNKWQIVEITTGHPWSPSWVDWSILQRGEYPNV